ncbi:MAG: TolC family protein [Kofleriaceae bacterium]|nr:TolC family protein [Kofleriaceae bacterium]
MKVVPVLVLVLASSASAAPADVSIDQAIELYRQHSPRLAATQANIGVAQADLVDARIYPNPTLGLSAARTVSGTDTIGHTQPTLSLDVPILIGGQRGRRADAAKAHVDVARASAARDQGDAELEIRARFATLLAAQDRTSVLAGALADAKALRDIVAGRSSAGAGSAYAVERIDLAIAALASRVDEATTDESTRAADLALVVGLPGWRPHALGDLAAMSPPQAIDPAHPALVADRADATSARADIARAKADGIPTPSIGLQTFATTDPAGWAVTAGVSVPLPLFDRNQGAVARARAEAHRATLELAATQSELTTALDRASAEAKARRDALARFRADALQRLSKVRFMAEASYKSGQGGIVELLDALDAITEAKLRELELRAAVADAELDVRRAAHGR